MVILDQQLNLLQMRKQDAEKELQSLRTEEANYLKALAQAIGVPTLNGWNLDTNTGKLTLKS